MGDGFLAEFPDTEEAVVCAKRVQQSMSEFEPGLEPEERLALRIGINEGELIYEGGDVFGDCVNVAARLEGMAMPGGILVSNRVRQLLQEASIEGFQDNGERKFKNIAQPIRVWSWPAKLPALRAATKPRLHVAGFAAGQTSGSDAADILSEEMHRHLARLTGLEVMNEPEKAHYIIGGAVRLAGERCRVAAQLVRLQDKREIWADRYDVPSSDPFDVADKCTPRIVMTLRRRIAVDDAERLRDRPLDELSLVELMALAGASFFNPTYEGWHGAGVIAEQALELDPNAFMALAMAAAGLGLAEPFFGLSAPSEPVLELAFDRIHTALRLNNRTDMLHAVHAGLHLYGRGRHADAEAAAGRGLEINPDYNMGWWMLGAAQVFAGHPEQGLSSAEHAIAIEPNDPYVHLYSRIAGYGHLGTNRPDLAADCFRRADQLAPGLPPNLLALVVSAHLAGDRESAAAARNTLLRAIPTFHMDSVAPLPYRSEAAWQHFWKTALEAGVPE
jgi:TolB-like protein